MAKKAARKARSKRRTKSRAEGPAGYICLNKPVCYAFDVQFRPNTVQLDSVDLFDPQAGGGNPWTTINVNLLSAQGTAAAMAALRRAATNGEFILDCDDDCECDLPKNWGPWGGWKRQDISGGFSIPAPNPPPARLRYRANGTVQARARMKIGVCIAIEL